MKDSTVALLTREQVREFDRVAIHRFGVPGVVLMENAGRGLAQIIDETSPVGSAHVACGPGNNGGDGFVIARHLEIRGWQVAVSLWCPANRFQGDAAINLEILRRNGTHVITCDGGPSKQVRQSLHGADAMVDALLGTGACGPAREPIRDAIEIINAAGGVCYAVDLPSGLDADSGPTDGPIVRADHVGTFVAAKPGLLLPQSKPFVGQLHIIDIGAPREVLRQFGLEPRPFIRS